MERSRSKEDKSRPKQDQTERTLEKNPSGSKDGTVVIAGQDDSLEPLPEAPPPRKPTMQGITHQPRKAPKTFSPALDLKSPVCMSESS